MSEEHPPQYAEHLEFLGYQCERQDDAWMYAAHPIRLNFFLRPFGLGLRLYCPIRLGRLSATSRAEWLDFINHLNERTSISTFTLEFEETDRVFAVRIRAVAPGEYNRSDFGAWMDTWHEDLDLFRDGPEVREDECAEDGEAKSVAGSLTVH